MDRQCDHCASAPDGIEGHPLLILNTEKPRKAIFVCNGCGTRWIRVYEGQGSFRWQRSPGTD